MRFTSSLLFAGVVAALPANDAYSHGKGESSCRFGLEWSQKDVLKKTDEFIWDLLYWEGKFHQNDVAYNTANGMSYDGTQLDWVTGERTKKHIFSAASKEVITTWGFQQK